MDGVYKLIIEGRNEVFGSRWVHGELWEEWEKKGGERAWLITFFEEGPPGPDYWVSGSEVREVLQQITSHTSPSNTFIFGPVVEDLAPAKSEAILQAIRKWEGYTEGS